MGKVPPFCTHSGRWCPFTHNFAFPLWFKYQYHSVTHAEKNQPELRFIIRIALLAASVLGAGVTAGRRLLADNVEKQKATIIEEASALAREKLDLEVRRIVRTGLQSLLVNTLVKFILVASAFIIYELGWISAQQFVLSASIMLGLFLIRDAVRLWPSAKLIVSQLHENGWRPKEAISQYVSASVFEQALEEVSEQTGKGSTRLYLQIAGKSPSQVSVEIAAAIANIAHETSYQQIRPRVAMAMLRAFVIIALYSAILFVIFNLV